MTSLFLTILFEKKKKKKNGQKKKNNTMVKKKKGGGGKIWLLYWGKFTIFLVSSPERLSLRDPYSTSQRKIGQNLLFILGKICYFFGCLRDPYSTSQHALINFFHDNI